MDSGTKIPDCPAEMALRLIGDKWRVLIIRDLLTGTKRFNELMRFTSGIIRRVLISHLRAMEQAGLVTRKIYPQVPPKMEYTLTGTGYSLKPIPSSMATWGTTYRKNTGQMQTRKGP